MPTNFIRHRRSALDAFRGVNTTDMPYVDHHNNVVLPTGTPPSGSISAAEANRILRDKGLDKRIRNRSPIRLIAFWVILIVALSKLPGVGISRNAESFLRRYDTVNPGENGFAMRLVTDAENVNQLRAGDDYRYKPGSKGFSTGWDKDPEMNGFSSNDESFLRRYDAVNPGENGFAVRLATDAENVNQLRAGDDYRYQPGSKGFSTGWDKDPEMNGFGRTRKQRRRRI